MSNIYQSKYKGQVIDQTVNDTASLKTRMEEAEGNIQYLNTHKANINIVPKSIKDLEPNASLVYVGTEEPSINCDIWFYPKDETEYIIKVRNNGGVWVDVASGSGISPTITITESTQGYTLVITDVTGSKTIEIRNGNDGYTPQKGIDYWTDADKAEIKAEVQPYVATLGIDEITNTVTDPLKHDGKEITKDELYNAYTAGRTVMLIVNNYILYTLIHAASTQLSFSSVTLGTVEKLTVTSSGWTYSVSQHQDEQYRTGSSNFNPDDYRGDTGNFYYPSTKCMVEYVEGITGNIATALDNIIAIQNSLMGVSK